MQTQMMSCHLTPTWHEWKANADDIMEIWFTSYETPSDVTSGMHNMHVHAWHMCSM